MRVPVPEDGCGDFDLVPHHNSNIHGDMPPRWHGLRRVGRWEKSHRCRKRRGPFAAVRPYGKTSQFGSPAFRLMMPSSVTPEVELIYNFVSEGSPLKKFTLALVNAV